MGLRLKIPEADSDSNSVHEQIAACPEYILEAIENGQILVPRTEGERRRGFAQWLTSQRTLLEPLIRNKLEYDLKSRDDQPAATTARVTAAVEQVWATVRPALIRYAILGLASAWAGRHLGDALLLVPTGTNKPAVTAPRIGARGAASYLAHYWR